MVMVLTWKSSISTVWLPMESDCLSIADFSSRQLDFNLHVVAQWCKHDSSHSRARERRSKWKTVKTAIEQIHRPYNFQDGRQFSQALFTKVEQIEVIRAWVRGYFTMGTGTAEFQVTWHLRIVQKGVSVWQCCAADRWLMSGAHTVISR